MWQDAGSFPWTEAKMKTNAVCTFIYITIHLCLSTHAFCTPMPPTTNKSHLSPTHPHSPNPGSRHRKREMSKKPPTPRFQDQDQARVFENLAGIPFLQLPEKERVGKVVGWRAYYYNIHPRPRNATPPLEIVRTWKNGKRLEWVVSGSFSPYSSTQSSSCSSLTCKWFSSWEFITVTSIMLTWLCVLTSLLCLARTAKGRSILDNFSSLFTREKKGDDNQVLAKGIGYFDGSPGMRRFVLIEDEDDDDDDASSDKSSEKQDSSSDDSKQWRPPRKGTYILQEAAKDYVLELGTYRLQEDIDEEVDEVEYVLEGATYILQSERVERNGTEQAGPSYGFVRGNTDRIEIEGLYGVIRNGGFDDRMDRIEDSYEFLDTDTDEWRLIERIDDERRETEGSDERETGRRRAETGIEERRDDGIRIRKPEEIAQIRKLSLDEIRQRRNEIRQRIENGATEAEIDEISRTNAQIGERGRGDSLILSAGKLADDHRGILKKNVGKTASEGGAMLNPRRSLGGARPRANTGSYTKRAASFPMDSYCPALLLPRKLSLIEEEEGK